MYSKYKQAVEDLEWMYYSGSADDSRRLAVLSRRFSQITEETNNLVEIMDIQDELEIVDSVLTVQQSVLRKLMQQMPKWAKVQSRVPEAIHILEENKASVQEMIISAKRVQEDVRLTVLMV